MMKCFPLFLMLFTAAAWAGLRPMTELELEKMVRGSRQPQPNEVGCSYWGVAGFNRWNWNAFKNDPQSERAVTVSNEKGLNFKGTHGLGSLTLPADWPPSSSIGHLASPHLTVPGC